MSNPKNIILITVIVNRGKASKVLKYSHKFGITGGTIMLGFGTINNLIYQTLCIDEVRKEIVNIVCEEEKGLEFLDFLKNEMKLYKPNHGIAFTRIICEVAGSNSLICNKILDREEDSMYKAVHIIVDNGKGESVVELARKAGATGATIINARGSGIHEREKLFNIEIEPEKEIVLIILKTDIVDKVIDVLVNELKINEPGNGLIYVQNLGEVYGLYEKE